MLRAGVVYYIGREVRGTCFRVVFLLVSNYGADAYSTWRDRHACRDKDDVFFFGSNLYIARRRCRRLS